MDIERLQIDANGLEFTARAAGPANGRPVMLLHGFPQTSWSWRHVLLTLASEGYRAVAPDQRGYASRARPPDVADYTMPNLVNDVLAIATTMEMPIFDLVGHDWGGRVAWVTAATNAERIRSLTVVSTPHPDALRLTRAASSTVERSTYIDLFRRPAEPERLLIGPEGTGSGIRALFSSAGIDPSVADEYVSTLAEPGALTAALNWYRADGTGVDGLPPIVVPTLYIWSTGDGALGRAAAEATAEFVAGRYVFAVMEGVSHWIPEQTPEELSRLVLEQLAST
jgi:pimeloyl-ACP methyl ester carboxylesterase